MLPTGIGDCLLSPRVTTSPRSSHVQSGGVNNLYILRIWVRVGVFKLSKK